MKCNFYIIFLKPLYSNMELLTGKKRDYEGRRYIKLSLTSTCFYSKERREGPSKQVMGFFSKQRTVQVSPSAHASLLEKLVL